MECRWEASYARGDVQRGGLGNDRVREILLSGLAGATQDGGAVAAAPWGDARADRHVGGRLAQQRASLSHGLPQGRVGPHPPLLVQGPWKPTGRAASLLGGVF